MLEEISSRSEFGDRETVVRPLRVVYADHSRLEHRGIAAGGVVAAPTGGFELASEQDGNEEKGLALAVDFDP